ncbi:bacteriophage protein homolog [Synechococcus sp. CC9311]|nr:bacteriophage protein homolog [Synechococcus sp. CC9311]
MLTVVKRSESLAWSGQKRRAWLCKCDCGGEIVVSGKHLRSGHTQSCGCRVVEVPRQLRLQDITGKRYVRLAAVRRLPDEEQRIRRNGRPIGDWEWLCDCGNSVVLPIGAVKSGATQSCGCLGLETRPLNFHNEGHRAYAGDPEYAER